MWLSQVPLSHLSPLASITVTVCLHRVTYPLASGCNESRTGCPPRTQRSATDTISTVTPTTIQWLPVEARITYKLCLLMYRVVHRTAPV